MRIKNRFYGFSIRNRLILIFTGAMLSGMILLGIILFWIMYKNIQKNTYQNIKLTVDATSDAIEQSMVLVQNTTLILAASDPVKSWLSNADYYNQENTDYFLRKEELKGEMLRTISYSNAKKLDFISYATIYAQNQMLEYAYIKQIGIKTIREESEQAYNYILENDEEYVYSVPIIAGNNTIFHIRRMKSDFSSDQQLVIMVATNENLIREKYQDLVEGIGDIVFLTDYKNVVFSSNVEEQIGNTIDRGLAEQILDNDNNEILYQGVKYYATLKKQTGTGSHFVYLYPKSKIAEQVFSGMKSYIVISFFIMVTFFAIGLVLQIQSTKFINEFVYAMKSIKEKNMMSKSINIMIQRLICWRTHLMK